MAARFKLVKSDRKTYMIDDQPSLELWYESSEPISRRDAVKEIREQFEKMKRSDRNVRVQVAAKFAKLNWRSGKMIHDVRDHKKWTDAEIVYDGDGSVQLDDPTKNAGGVVAFKFTVIKNA